MDITAASATVPSTSPPARSRQLRAEWPRLILLLGVTAEMVNGATALRAESVIQRLHLDPSSQVVTAGDLATVTIVYDCESPAVTGVGVGIYYDSSKLALESAAVLFSDDSVGAGDITDDDNLDGDATTDRRYLAGWASLTGEWPGNDVALPLELVTLSFRTHAGYLSADLSMTGQSCAECSVDLGAATIQVVGGGPTYTPTATPSATGTRTPLPTPTFGPSPTPQGPFGPPGGAPPPPGGAPPDDALNSPPQVPTASHRGLMLLTLALAGGATALLLRQHR
jgi:hypothetical protein